MKSFRPFLISLMLFSSVFTLNLYSQSGFSESEALYQKIRNMGYTGEKSFLSTEYQDWFQYNMIYRFGNDENLKNCLVILMDQHDMKDRLPFLKTLMDFYSEKSNEYNIEMVLLANDSLDFPGNEEVQATEYYSYDLKGTVNTAVLILDFSGTKGNKVIPGSEGEVSPQYLTIPLCRLMEKEGIPFSIAGGFFISLYRLGILRNDNRLSSFLSQETPALEIDFLKSETGSQSLINILESFPKTFMETDTSAWSRHYIPIKLFNSKTLWITEQPLVLFLVVIAIVSLFILSDFSFILRKLFHKKEEEKKTAFKTTYIIPATLFLQVISLFIGQAICSGFNKMNPSNPFVMLAVKLILAFFILSAFFVLEIKFHRDVPALAYEYILTLSAVINIFVFSVIDISLMPVFVLEYIILYISRPAKKNVFLYLFLFAILLPFIPLVQSIFLNSTLEKLFQFIFCNPAQNLAIAFLFLPFDFMWLRILARFNFNSGRKRKLFASYLIASSTCIFGLVIFYGISTVLLRKSLYNNLEPVSLPAEIIDSETSRLSTDVYDTEYYGSTIRHIELLSKEMPLRYLVKVSGKTSNPVYYSTFETDKNENGTSFRIPDFPPENFTLTYTPSVQEDATITIEAFYAIPETENGRLSQRRRIFREVSSYSVTDGNITSLESK